MKSHSRYRARKKSRHPFIQNLLFFIGGLLLVSVLYEQPGLLFALVLGFCGLQLTLFKQPEDGPFFIIGMLLGTVTELVAIPSGVWSYAEAPGWGLPLWVPFALGMMMVLVKRMVNALS
jgi:hypothetical protein